MKDAAYFAAYGPGGKRSYSRSWRDFTFDPADVIALYRTLFDKRPQTLLDLGAADGSLLKAFLKRGVDAVGVEQSRYIHRTIKSPELLRRILLADSRAAIRTLPDRSFDIVIECTAQYLPRRSLPAYFKQLRRVSSRLLCLLVQFPDIDDRPHTGVVTFAERAWWQAALRKAGFRHVAGGEGFFYR